MQKRKRTQTGYTLIEILVVIFIMGIVSSVALLSISFNENRQVESFTNELVQKLTLAEEQAILQPVVLGLTFDGSSYQFASYQAPENNKKASWTLIEDKILAKQSIPNKIELNVEINGHAWSSDENEKTKNPPVVISSTGDITPFTLYVGIKGKKPRYVIRGDADGNVISKALS